MGVDLSCMIRNRFHSKDNHEACMKYINETLELLNSHYSQHYIFDQFEYDERYNYDAIRVYQIIEKNEDTGIFMDLQLYNGFWHVELGYHYCQYFFKNLWLRQQLYELAKLLGEKEIWPCSEYYSWNSATVNLEDESIDFDTWKQQASKELGMPIPTLDIEEVLNCKYYFYDAEGVYFDPCSDYNEKMDVCESLFREYKIKNLLSCGPCVLLEKDNRLFLLNTKTKNFVIDDYIDELVDFYCGYRFYAVKDGKSALFDRFGNQLSKFDVGTFKMELGRDAYLFKNEQTGFCDSEHYEHR